MDPQIRVRDGASMLGRTMLMEFRKSWKGFSIFIIVVVVVSAGMAQLFPVISEAFEEVDELEGEGFIHIIIEEELIHLSWKENDTFVEYVIIEDSHPYMVTSREIDRTSVNLTYIPHTEEEERYFGVIGITQDSMEIPLGMTSTVEPRDPMEELMETPFYRMFTAGRSDVTFEEMEGFLSVELYSWWILLVGIYLAYISVKSITEDFEERRMDVIFSTPLPRRQYLLEKFFSLSLFTLLMLVLSGLFLMLSVRSVGEPGGTVFFISLVASWPMFTVIIAVSILLAVMTKSSRIAVGVTFAFILVQYSFFMAGHMLKSLEFALPYTISYYWDYNSVLLDGAYKPVNFLILILVTSILIAGALYVFQNEDIPA